MSARAQERLNPRISACGTTAVLLVAMLGLAIAGFAQLFTEKTPAGVGAFVVAAGLGAGVSIPACAVLVRLGPGLGQLLLLALAWGAAISTGTAALLNSLGQSLLVSVLRGLDASDAAEIGALLTPIIVGPLVEEAVKAIGILLLGLRFAGRLGRVRDAVALGAAVGLGFTIVETAVYGMAGYEAGVLDASVEQFVARFALLGLSGHLLFSALAGAGLGLALQSRRRGRPRGRVPALLAVLAVLAHLMDNTFGTAVTNLTGSALAGALGIHLADAGIPIAAALIWVATVVSTLVVLGAFYLVLWRVLVRAQQDEAQCAREGGPPDCPGARTAASTPSPSGTRGNQ